VGGVVGVGGGGGEGGGGGWGGGVGGLGPKSHYSTINKRTQGGDWRGGSVKERDNIKNLLL